MTHAVILPVTHHVVWVRYFPWRFVLRYWCDWGA